jgi:gamma-glutamyltranspeptidase/glutathione hydrolase
VQLVHLFAEASRLAYADRAAYIGDPAFVDVPVTGMLDKDYLASRAKLIDPKQAMAVVTAGTPPGSKAMPSAKSPEGQHTTHFSIVDHEGNVLAMTSSVQIPYGSGLMAAGFILNNELTDFETVPRQNGVPVANRPEGGKRPRSSMDPTIVFDKKHRPVLAIGSPGGSRIIGYVTQALIAYLDSGLPLDQVMAQPHHNTPGSAITLETGTPIVELKEELEAMGHKVQIRDMDSGLHAIALSYEGDEVILTGAADPRREGVALEAR